MPLVLLHPVGLDAECWTFSGLQGRMPEYPGHGAQPLPPSGKYTLEEVADEIVKNNKGILDIVGISMGAAVAQYVALRHPKRVRSLLLAAGGSSGRASAQSDEPVSGPLKERADLQASSSMADTLDTTLKRWFTEEALNTPGHPGVEYVKKRWLANDPKAIAATWMALGASAIKDLQPTIECPVSVVGGRFDMAGGPTAKPVETAEALQSLFPTSRLEIIDGPHMLHIERPTEFATAVKKHRTWAASLDIFDDTP